MVVPQPAQSVSTAPPVRGHGEDIAARSEYATVAPSPEILGLKNPAGEVTRVIALPEAKSRARTDLGPSWLLR